MFFVNESEIFQLRNIRCIYELATTRTEKIYRCAQCLYTFRFEFVYSIRYTLSTKKGEYKERMKKCARLCRNNVRSIFYQLVSWTEFEMQRIFLLGE